MKRTAALLLIGGMIQAVHADLPYQPRFTWTPPSAFTDGSTLTPATDLESYLLTCTGERNLDITIPSSLTEYEANAGVFPEGNYTCRMQSKATAAMGGLESDYSDSVSFSTAEKAPTIIINFAVQ